MILGICSGERSSSNNEDIPYMVAACSDGNVQGAAVMTSGRNLLVTDTDEDFLKLVADDLQRREALVPGVAGPVSSARCFAEIWSTATGAHVVPGMRMRIYQLERVVSSNGAGGSLRQATD